MKRLAIALLVVAACGGKSKKTNTAGTGSDGPAVYAKKVSLGWGITQTGAKADVYLEATDETGHMVSHKLGTFDGTCQAFTPAPDMKAVTGVQCTSGVAGTELHAVIQRDHVIVLKMATQAGTTPDPMAREQIAEIEVPPGAAIEASPPTH